MARRSKYSSAEKMAYKTGRAYRLGRECKKINFKNGSKLKDSFQAGYKNAGKNLSKYDDARK